MSWRDIVEQGKFLRQFVSEPVSSLVRQEDLSYCASRLLLLSQYIRRREQALAALIEESLQDLARLNPDGAIQRVRGAEGTFPSSPVYWCLACHVLAQVLSEFANETRGSTVTDLRSSLGTWFPRLRQTLEGMGGVADDKQFVCLQCFLTQCAIFHDATSFEWAADRLLSLITPQTLTSDVVQDCAALLTGIYGRPQDEAMQRQLAAVLTQAAQGNERLSETAVSLVGVIAPSEMERASAVSGPSGPVPSMTSKSIKKPRVVKKSRFAGLGEVVGSYSWVFVLVGIIGVAALCVGAFGLFYDFWEGKTNVGQQSLSSWYSGTKTMQEKDKKDGKSPAPEPQAPTLAAPAATAAPTAPPGASPATDEEIRAALPALIAKHTRYMQSRLGLPRQVSSGEAGAASVTVNAEYLRSNPPSFSNARAAQVDHLIRWFENGRQTGVNIIETHYEWTGTEWKLKSARRCLNQNDASGRMMYADAPNETAWAEALFATNPFYD